jgi:ketosteroid isomerase-like protein
MILLWMMIAAPFCTGDVALPFAAGGLPVPQDLQEQVRQAEEAFARTMADRDLEAFAAFVSQEAIFFGGPETLRGREAVVEGWRPFFEGADPPFSWEPEVVEVLPSGTLAHSSGPVKDPHGNVMATYNSVWRLETDGKWRVVFDKGCPAGGQ